MLKIYTSVIILLIGFSASAQSLSTGLMATTAQIKPSAKGSFSPAVAELNLSSSAGKKNSLQVSVPSNEKFGAISLYQNPAVENLSYGFQFPCAGTVAAMVYDVTGKKIGSIYQGNYVAGKTEQVYDVSNLMAGMYYISLQFTSTADKSTHVLSKPFQVIK